MVETHKKPSEVFRAVVEQEVDAFVQEAFCVRVQAEGIKEDIARRLILRGLRGSESDVPSRASLARLSQQELAQHPERVRPERIDGQSGPLRRVSTNLLQELEARPIRREIVLELDAVGLLVQAQRKLVGPLRKRRRVRRLQVGQREAALERCFSLGEAHHQRLHVGAVFRPVFPEAVGDAGVRCQSAGVGPQRRACLNDPRQCPQVRQRRDGIVMCDQPA